MTEKVQNKMHRQQCECIYVAKRYKEGETQDGKERRHTGINGERQICITRINNRYKYRDKDRQRRDTWKKVSSRKAHKSHRWKYMQKSFFIRKLSCWYIKLLVCWSQLHASQGRICTILPGRSCWSNFPSHLEYTDTRPTSPSIYPKRPGSLQGNHRVPISTEWKDSTWDNRDWILCPMPEADTLPLHRRGLTQYWSVSSSFNPFKLSTLKRKLTKQATKTASLLLRASPCLHSSTRRGMADGTESHSNRYSIYKTS